MGWFNGSIAMPDQHSMMNSLPGCHPPSSSYSGSSTAPAVDRIPRLSKERERPTQDEPGWRDAVRQQLEKDLHERVHEALPSPPLEKLSTQQQEKSEQKKKEFELFNERLLHGWKRDSKCFLTRKARDSGSLNSAPPTVGPGFQDKLLRSDCDEYPSVFGLHTADFREVISHSRNDQYFRFNCDQGSNMNKYRSFTGVSENAEGFYYPNEGKLLLPGPKFRWWADIPLEPLSFQITMPTRTTVDNQETPYSGKWGRVITVFDSERSPLDHLPHPAPSDCCPSLVFESRFESGNLRQARRVGQFEYELVLKADLYTSRHTQWYLFRVQNTMPGVTYKFRIVNLLKRDSLYNHGMRPLIYSENEAKINGIGWLRTGHHIFYSRNVMNLHCPLLVRGTPYYMLEWQMEFPNMDDTYYLAHCYPYTYTDLKEDIDRLLADPAAKLCLRREVLCETRAGNSCFILTVTNFDVADAEKKAIVLTARVHPGESQASWVMKGIMDFITSKEPVAKNLRRNFIFKMVPMLNPDGVIIGNYRCSLAARDLNRNYRHPKKDNFPTVWYTKNMIERLMEKYEVILYCDLHGHSRKHNVFMYGNNTAEDDLLGIGSARAFLNERLFPWLMAQKAPEKFSFQSCKFHITKCKESTGRVVMWRQLRVVNSFTLEAAFSGTVINKSQSCHFNIFDYQEMGRTLCHVIHDYHQAQADKTWQAKIILSLTRQITHQIFQNRGLLPPKLPNLKGVIRETRQVRKAETNSAIVVAYEGSLMKPNQDVHPACYGLDNIICHSDRNCCSSPHEMTAEGRKMSPLFSLSESSSSMQGEEIHSLVDNMPLKTMENCLKFLADLNARSIIVDSDSSDSDSGAEPELKLLDLRPKKEKKHSRKKKDHGHGCWRRCGSDGAHLEARRPKMLPDIPVAATLTTAHDLALTRKQQQQMSRELRIARQYPFFARKYEGRSNGGIPCFAQERSLERAAKKLADVKKQDDDSDAPKEELEFCYSADHLENMSVLCRAWTQVNLQQKLRAALHQGTENLTQTLGLSFQTGYIHADNLQVSPTQYKTTLFSSTENSYHGHSCQQKSLKSLAKQSAGMQEVLGKRSFTLDHLKTQLTCRSSDDIPRPLVKAIKPP